MPIGKRLKRINGRAELIKKELTDRLAKVKRLRKKDSKETYQSALEILTARINISSTLHINYDECLPEQGPYKRALPKGYIQVVKTFEAGLKRFNAANSTSLEEPPVDNAEGVEIHEIPPVPVLAAGEMASST